MKIYIVLTYTGTILAKIIKYYTRCEFAHVSIALDKKMNAMYSFGRLNPYNPFKGGFIHERIGKGTFKRFKNTSAIIYSLEVTEQQYKTIQNIILLMKKNKKQYTFNTIGLFAVAFHIRVRKKMAFYCAEFVKYLLDSSEVKNNLPNVIKPEDFKKLKNLELVYCGRLNEYDGSKEVVLR